MKKLLITITLCLFTMPAFAGETFAPVTPDNTVTAIDQVQVKKVVSETVETETLYTLPQIDTKIAKIQARIEHLNGDIAVLQALRAKIETEAKKVQLAKDTPQPEGGN